MNSFTSAFGSGGGGGGGAGLGANTFTGAQTVSVNGAASTPPLSLRGTWFTGGSATTTKPTLLVEPSGTTSTAWSTSGTGLGVNAPSGFTGNLLDLQLNGAARFTVQATGDLYTKGYLWGDNGAFYLRNSGATDQVNMLVTNLAVTIAPTWKLGFSSASAYGMAPETYFTRSAASVMALLGATNGGAFELTEMTAPSAPATNKVRFYAEDNGSGKTRLMALFPTGGAQQIAIEP